MIAQTVTLSQKIDANRQRDAAKSRDAMIAKSQAAWDQEDQEILAAIQSGNASPAFIALYGPQVGIYPDPTPEPPAESAAPTYATLPPMGGGAHTAAELDTPFTTIDTDKMNRNLAASRSFDAIVERVVASYGLAKDATPYLLDRYQGDVSNMTTTLYIESLDRGNHMIQANAGNQYITYNFDEETFSRHASANTYGATNGPVTIIDAIWRRLNDPYNNLPPMGGGAHTAAEMNRATSQKRDNDRAERARINDAYHANATTQAANISDMLSDLGFNIASTKATDEEWVWSLWHDANGQASVKQTPYTIRIYNGRKMHYGKHADGKHADGKLTNRINHGWCQDGETTGYAAGLVAALLPLLETPDPLMEAIDAMETGEQSPTPAGWVYEDELPATISDEEYAERFPDSRVIDGVRMFPPAPTPEETIDDLNDQHSRTLARWNNSKQGPARQQLRKELDEIENKIRKIDPENYRVQWQGIEFLRKQQTPALILTGGQPAMTGPWQDTTYPPISGGSHPMSMEDDASNGADTGYEITTHEQIAARRQQAFIDTEKAYQKITNKCPGFYSSQAGAHLRCTERKLINAEYCDGCQKAITREEQHEMDMDRLDQWGR